MNVQASSRLNTVSTYYFADKLRQIAHMQAEGRDIINLGIGSPDLPPHPDVIKALSDAALQPSNHGYQSYRGIPELREAFSAWYADLYGFKPDPEHEVLPLMGSKEGIMHLSMALLEPGDVVLVPNPGYPTYAAAARLAGADVKHYSLQASDGWAPDLNALEQCDLSKIKIMWLNYPHMPTGARGSAALFQNLVAFAKEHDILLCNDNPYNAILNPSPLSLLAQNGAKEVAVELNSLSKTFNMAGWRVGVLLGNEQIINTVLKFKSNMDSGMFKPLQLAAARALQLGPEWMEQLNRSYATRRELGKMILESLGCNLEQSQAGLFLWAPVPASSESAEQLSEHLLHEAGVFITPGHIFGSAGDRYLRISLCTPEARLQEALERCKSLQLRRA